jgi:archaellum component FlaG (FlaF/FlaG flagellin family)
MYIPILIALALLGGLVFTIIKHNKTKRIVASVRKHYADLYADYLDLKESEKQQKAHLLKGHIEQSLTIMDSVANDYSNEDEANKELCALLKLLGHDAQYHFNINGRETDIFVDGNAVIEGKLSPNQSETDRIRGQNLDYLATGKEVYNVIYGTASLKDIDLIKQQLYVHLVYLDNPKRNRITVEKV